MKIRYYVGSVLNCLGVYFAVYCWGVNTVSVSLVFLWWMSFAVVSYATNFAYWQREYAIIAKRCYAADRRGSLISAMAGPITAFVIVGMGHHKHGLKFI